MTPLHSHTFNVAERVKRSPLLCGDSYRYGSHLNRIGSDRIRLDWIGSDQIDGLNGSYNNRLRAMSQSEAFRASDYAKLTSSKNGKIGPKLYLLHCRTEDNDDKNSKMTNKLAIEVNASDSNKSKSASCETTLTKSATEKSFVCNSQPTTATTTTTLTTITSDHKYKLSRQRWSVLVALCVFGFCNGIVSSLSDLKTDRFTIAQILQ